MAAVYLEQVSINCTSTKNVYMLKEQYARGDSFLFVLEMR